MGINYLILSVTAASTAFNNLSVKLNWHPKENKIKFDQVALTMLIVFFEV